MSYFINPVGEDRCVFLVTELRYTSLTNGLRENP